MTSRERILAALEGKEVDYVPLCTSWNTHRLHEKLSWKSESQRLGVHRDRGWDTWLSVYPAVTPAADVRIDSTYLDGKEGTILRQIWHTPAGTIRENLKATEDWDELASATHHMGFMSDFRTSRYLEFPFKDHKDLDALDYLFPLENPLDTESIVKEYAEKRKLADEYGFPLFTYYDAGMDWLLWLFPAEEAVMRVVDDPPFVREMLSRINRAKLERLKLLLDLGIDGVKRRGWYESADFWSPKIFRDVARPAIEEEIDLTHRAGKPFMYIMVTGVMPLLPELATMKFDCLVGPDPVVGGQDFKMIRSSLSEKTLWGGFSATEHFISGGPREAQKAVEDAFEICGKRRFILGMECSFRYYFKWENFEAAEMAWKRLR
jgi:hypothetical protein